MKFLSEIFLAIFLIYGALGFADGGCTETSCVQSHVSTSGSNYFSLSCTAQFANHRCEGRPLIVTVNRCVDVQTLSLTRPLDDKGVATHPGECGAQTERVRVSCDKACREAGYEDGFCETRRLNCFQQWRESGFCRCG